MSIHPEDLDLVPTDTLLEILRRRFDGCAFIAYNDLNAKERQVYRNWKGDIMVLCGYATQLQVMLLAAQAASAHEPSE